MVHFPTVTCPNFAEIFFRGLDGANALGIFCAGESPRWFGGFFVYKPIIYTIWLWPIYRWFAYNKNGDLSCFMLNNQMVD